MTQTTNNAARIRTVLARLEQVLKAETEALGASSTFDLKTSNAIKSRCLYELTMLFRSLKPGQIDRRSVQHFQHLKKVLAANEMRVKAHMNAVREVADILKGAAREAEADGTYSMEQFRYNEFL